MIINHNLQAMNSYRQLGINAANGAKSTEKLSSGLRINRAGDDAAGLAISEKMRAQIRGLDQASRNSQDGISMIQTAEGALQETHSILQRMRELATQAANDTNVAVDRNEIQKEINQLTSEINRIGNTTEFNTQSLLKGDGKVSLNRTGTFNDFQLAGGTDRTTVEGKVTYAITNTETSGMNATSKMVFSLGGESLTVSFATNDVSKADFAVYNATANNATVNLSTSMSGKANEVADALAKAVQTMIDNNSVLKGNFTATASNGTLTISAVKGGAYEGNATSGWNSGGAVYTVTNISGASGNTAGSTTAAVQASGRIQFNFSGDDLIGKGLTINGKQYEFYNANAGAYTGNAIGINIASGSTAAQVVTALVNQAKADGVTLSVGASGAELALKAVEGGTAGNNIKIADGGKQENFQATFQVGANKGQSMTIDIADMRAAALGITGAKGTSGFTSSLTVTDGTSNKVQEASLDVSTAANASNAIKIINNAIEKVSAERSKLGAFQNRLEHTINNLNTASENLTASESRIRDTDMAKEVMNNSKNNILAQAAQAMLAQANQNPQQVLQLLR